MPTTVERWTSTLRSPNAADVGPCPSWTRWSLLPPRARGLVVLHYDADFELVAEITGQPHEWVVARGTLD